MKSLCRLNEESRGNISGRDKQVQNEVVILEIIFMIFIQSYWHKLTIVEEKQSRTNSHAVGYKSYPMEVVCK